MAAKLIDRPLAFAVPQVGAAGALLPQQAALGTVARIRQTAPDYFNVTVQEHGNELGEIRFYIVRKTSGLIAGGRGGWVVERPGVFGEHFPVMATFRPQRLREALAWAVRYVTADWIIEVRDGGQAR
jgi:hypothetical protein